jgi:hypothetical protein
MVAAGLNCGVVLVYDWKIGRLFREIPIHDNSVVSLLYLRQFDLVFSGSSDKFVAFHDWRRMETRKFVKVHHFVMASEVDTSMRRIYLGLHECCKHSSLAIVKY